MVMANFFSKYFSEIALMATAILWAGCGNVDKDSKNEKSVSSASNSFGVSEISNSVESSDSAALQNVTEKDDSLVSEILKDSLDANAQTVVLLDSAKLLEKQRTRDSLMKVFFPIERTRIERKFGLRYDIGRMLNHGSAKRRNSFRTNLFNIGTKVCYYGVIAPRPSIRNTSVDGILQALNGGASTVKLRGAVKVLYEKIEFADKQTFDQNLIYRIKRFFQQRTPGLRHVYRKFLKKNSDNTFEGEITFKLTIAADENEKKSSISFSTTGVKDFDEEIKKLIGLWTIPKVKSGTTVVYVPIRFYEEDKTSSQSK